MDGSHFLKIKHNGDFPGSPVVKNLSSSTGDVALIPGREIKIPHPLKCGQKKKLKKKKKETVKKKREDLKSKCHHNLDSTASTWDILTFTGKVKSMPMPNY